MWSVGVRAGNRGADRRSVLGWESEGGGWGILTKAGVWIGPRVAERCPCPRIPASAGRMTRWATVHGSVPAPGEHSYVFRPAPLFLQQIFHSA